MPYPWELVASVSLYSTQSVLCKLAFFSESDEVFSFRGSLVASQAERDHFRYLRKETRLRVKRSCAGEMEREVHAVLGPVGVEEKLSRQVADSLLLLEDEQVAAEEHQTLAAPTPVPWFQLWRREAKNDNESGLRWSEDVGLTAFLLKFGQGLGKHSPRSVHRPSCHDSFRIRGGPER